MQPVKDCIFCWFSSIYSLTSHVPGGGLVSCGPAF